MSAIDTLKKVVRINKRRGIENDSYRSSFLESLLKEIEQLRALVENVPEGCTPADARMLREANHGLTAELEALRQERDGLRADAARYRWLRKQHEKHLGLTIRKVGMFDLTLWYGDDPDAAIDAAMAKEQGYGN